MKKVYFYCLFLLFFCLCPSAQIIYHDAAAFPLYGKATNATNNVYSRLPDSLKNISREPLWYLSHNSAGLGVRFSSNSTTIGLKWENLNNYRMNHMTDTGVRGLDLYTFYNGKWMFVNSARPANEKKTQFIVIANMDAVDREYMLYLPLYDGVDSLYIGVDSLSYISQPKINLPVRSKPIIFYGTSILQGGCASRPGMASSHIITRRLNKETINLGFSGNAFLDYEIAEVMAQINAGVFVLDFVPNASIEQIRDKTETFLLILRSKHSNTPVLFIEGPLFTHSKFDRKIAKEIKEKNNALRVVFDALKENGYENINLISSENMIGEDGEATIDGIHFTDIGMMRYADLICPAIERILNDRQ